MYLVEIKPPAGNILGQAVKTNDEMVSLTDLWKASGRDNSKKPAMWFRTEAASEFIKELAKRERVAKSQLVRIRRGGGDGGGTYAHWQIALAYAKYLSPEMHMAANAVFRGYVNADPAAPSTTPPCSGSWPTRTWPSGSPLRA